VTDTDNSCAVASSLSEDISLAVHRRARCQDVPQRRVHIHDTACPYDQASPAGLVKGRFHGGLDVTGRALQHSVDAVQTSYERAIEPIDCLA
jgi:hypothetical protein